MVLTVDKELKKIVATVQNGSRVEKYECVISACENPVCTCATTYLDLIPLQVGDDNREPLHLRKVEINIDEESLGYKNIKKVPKEDLKFAKLFISQLDKDDFQVLYKSHFAFKNVISEKASPDAIDVCFDYHAVEYDGLMYGYNDILPYGDQFIVTLKDGQCIIFDQYCLLPKCPCSDTDLDIISIDKHDKIGKELCFVSVNYEKKQWKLRDEFSYPISLESLRTYIEEQHPDIYKQLHKRHLKLKSIYGNCKKKHYVPKQELQLSKAGRNDPCPCGSGKKYKKCCLR